MEIILRVAHFQKTGQLSIERLSIGQLRLPPAKEQHDKSRKRVVFKEAEVIQASAGAAAVEMKPLISHFLVIFSYVISGIVYCNIEFRVVMQG